VAKVNLGDGVWTEFAIEYERTLKSGQKYEKILEVIANERRIQAILYLTSSYEIAATLRWYFQRTRHEILFALWRILRRTSSIRRSTRRAQFAG